MPGPSDAPRGSAATVPPPPGPRGRLGFWQKRYLLRQHRDFDDRSLAAACGVSAERVASYLASQGAVRSGGDRKRIEQLGDARAPQVFTPEVARRALTRLATRPLTRLDAVLIAAVGLGSLVLYALTCARTVTGEDAGELLAAAHGLGVPHPPGYPLWLALSWAADHAAPLLSTAWRVSMVSAVFAAAANALLLAVALKTLRHRLASFTAAALFAVSRTHWTQAVIPEVYGLNTFFIALQVLLLVRLAERPTTGRLAALAAVSGLSATNHTSAVPLAAVFALGALLVAPQLFRSLRTVALALLAGVLPLLLYFVLPLASMREPYIDWGNPETLHDLWRHATRAQYAEVEAGKTAAFDHGDYLRRLQVLGDWASRQFGSGWVLLLAAVGMFPLFVRQTGLWLLLVGIGWLSSVGITRYTAFAFEREHIYANQIFWIPAWLVLAWFLGGGIDALLSAAERLLRTGSRRAASALAAVGCLALVAWPASEHYAVADRSRTTLIDSFGRGLLDSMGQGALYFPSSDHTTFPVLYEQAVADYRTDVVVADKTGEIDKDVLARTLTAEDVDVLLHTPKANYRETVERLLLYRWPGPVYFANRRDMRDCKDRVLEPAGLVFQVMTPDEAAAWWARGEGETPPPGLRAWEPLMPLLAVDDRQRLDFTVQMVHGDMLYMRGFALLRAGDIEGASAVWNRIAGDLAPLKQQFNNIGSALAENGRPAEALAFYERAVAEDPRYLMGLRNLTQVLTRLGRSDEALVVLRQAVEAEPEQRDVRLELARRLAQAGRNTEALAEYEALAKADRNDPVSFREAGKLMMDLGDLDKARTLLGHAAEVDPADTEVAQWLEQIQQGAVALNPELPPLVPGQAPEWMPDAAGTGMHPGSSMIPALPQDPAAGLQFDPMLGMRRPGGAPSLPRPQPGPR